MKVNSAVHNSRKRQFGLLVSIFLFSLLFPNDISLNFKPIQVEGNFSVSIVHSIIEGNDGFLWFGTVDGLTKYDGYTYKVFRNIPGNESSLSSNAIRSIYEDKNGFIWVGTQEGGLNKFDKTSEKFRRFYNQSTDKSGYTGTNAWKIFEDSEGTLWVGSWNFGLYKTNPTSSLKDPEKFLNFQHDPSDNTSLSHNIVREIYEDSKGNLWIGTQGGGLNKYDKKNSSFISYQHHPEVPTSLSNNSVYAILEDSRGNLWIGTNGGGLELFHRDTETFTHYYDNESDHIGSIIELQPGILLVGTENGLRMFDIEKGEFSLLPSLIGERNELNAKLIRSLKKDSKNLIWVGTEYGVYKSTVKKNFEIFRHNPDNKNSISFNTIRAITEDFDGNYWVGTLGKGLNRYNPLTKQWTLYKEGKSANDLDNNSVQSLLSDSRGNLWVGSLNGAIQKYIPEKDAFKTYRLEINPVNKPNLIQSIIEGPEGLIWIGTENGLCRFNPVTETWNHIRHEENNPLSLSGNNIQSKAVTFDQHGNLWVGTWSNGLNFIAASELSKKNPVVKHWKNIEENQNTVSNNNILAIHEDKRGFIWIGTYGGGLNRLDPKNNQFKVYTMTDGLPNNVIFGILEDDEGNLWLSTSNGLSRFNYTEEIFTNFDQNDGLQGNAFFWGASYKNREGWMYFGGQNGLNRFHPRNIRINSRVPDIAITNFKVYNKDKRFEKSITKLDEVSLSYRDNYFSIYFTALDFSDPSRNKFKYKLEGFDKEWIESGTQQYTSYTNLPGGKYTFKVIGSNNDNTWNTTGTKLGINIIPPVYKTWWFRVLIIVVTLLVLFSAFILRERRIKKQSTRLKLMVDARTNELNNANKRLEAQNIEISQQKEEVEQHRNKILEQNRELELHRNNLEELINIRTNELAMAKEKAEESDRMKTSFLANMSHEIRTPLNAIVGFSNLLNEIGISHEERDEYIELINRNSDSLLVLVNDILDLSNIEAGRLKIQKNYFQLNDFIEGIYNYWKVSYLHSNLDFRLLNELEDQRFELYSDEYRLKQIITNLIGNASKFTDSGYIELHCKKINNDIVISIKDTGIGISEENQRIIFERFRKIEDDSNKVYRGSGLGLAISLRLANLLEADIWVESAINEGSTFYLAIPFRGRQGAVETSKPEEILPKRPDWSGKKFLVAEDEETNYLYLKSLLKKTGAEIEWAKNGQSAIDYINDNGSVDIVLMDIKMPDVSGYEATGIIKKDNPGQIIIAQTAYAMQKDVERIKNAGFDDYISKPINPELLFNIVNKFL
jgi:signal transduction histidine kinase/ligand-binding sensor domain-containing protein/CheY-like chemotaxis protein